MLNCGIHLLYLAYTAAKSSQSLFDSLIIISALLNNIQDLSSHTSICLFCQQNFFRLVDELLCELVAEMGITREQFKAACESSAANPTHHRIVQ